MPERGRSPVDPLDDDTAERLVTGRVRPDDAPPGYARVAGVLQAAAARAYPEELAGQDAALAMFRAHGPGPEVRRARGRPHDRGRLNGRGRRQLVAVALAGAVTAGGLWTAAGAPFPPGLPSRAGAPQSGGARSGAPGTPGSPGGPGVPGAVTQARPMTSAATPPGANAGAPAQPPGANAGVPAQPSATDPSTGTGGGVIAGGPSSHGARRHRPGRPPKPESKPKPEKPKPAAEPGNKPKPEHQG